MYLRNLRRHASTGASKTLLARMVEDKHVPLAGQSEHLNLGAICVCSLLFALKTFFVLFWGGAAFPFFWGGGAVPMENGSD